MSARLKEMYEKNITESMIKRFGYKNRMQVPRPKKIVLNMGIGQAIQNPKAMDGAVTDLSKITGQRPSIRRAKKSVSNFKINCRSAVLHPRVFCFHFFPPTSRSNNSWSQPARLG